MYNRRDEPDDLTWEINVLVFILISPPSFTSQLFDMCEVHFPDCLIPGYSLHISLHGSDMVLSFHTDAAYLLHYSSVSPEANCITLTTITIRACDIYYHQIPLRHQLAHKVSLRITADCVLHTATERSRLH